jgi:hypothetical protein
MLQTGMPWPAMVFDKVGNKVPAQANASDLPVLILVNGTGKILYNSSGNQNADFGKVTADLDKILATSSGDPPLPLGARTVGVGRSRPSGRTLSLILPAFFHRRRRFLVPRPRYLFGSSATCNTILPRV